MELDRYLIFLSALCVVVYSAETTIDLTSTTILAQGNTDVTEQLAVTTHRIDKDNLLSTDTPLDNEIEVEERVTSTSIRTTEDVPQVKELPTTKEESITVEAKEIIANDVTTTTPLPPVQATERSSLTTKNKHATEPISLRPTTQPPIVTITPGTVSQRITKPNQKKNKTRQKPTTTTTSTSTSTTTTTTTITPPVQETKAEERPLATNIPQKEMINPFYRPHRKSTVEVKKGTINAGALQHTKKRKPSKKDNGMSSLLYIPLMIQAQMIPMMLIQLKFFALKALAIGKLALIILGLNLLRNAIIGYNNDEQQYEQESLASAHYGYNGGPEYGSWVNRRMYRAHSESATHKQIPVKEPMTNEENTYGYVKSRLNRSQSRLSNNPYRGYVNQMHTKMK